MRPIPRPALAAVALLGVVVSAAPLPAAEKEGWSAIAEQRVLYTTNAFPLSSARRLALAEDPSQPTVVQVAKPSDVVWEPSVDVRRASSNRLGILEVSAKAQGFIFTDHAALTHGNYRLQVRQALLPETSLLLRYRDIPNLLLGPNFERRTAARTMQAERVTSHIWRAQLEHALAEAVRFAMTARAGLRLYNDVFAERDTIFYTLGPHLDSAARPDLILSLGYQYERGLADGRGDVRFNDDVSLPAARRSVRHRAVEVAGACPVCARRSSRPSPPVSAASACIVIINPQRGHFHKAPVWDSVTERQCGQQGLSVIVQEPSRSRDTSPPASSPAGGARRAGRRSRRPAPAACRPPGRERTARP